MTGQTGSIISVSDHSSYSNKRPQTGQIKQQNFTSYGSGGLAVQDRVAGPPALVRRLFLVCRQQSSCCVLAWRWGEGGRGRGGEREGGRGLSHLIRTLTVLGSPTLTISCKPNHLPKDPLLISSSQGLELQPMYLEGTQTCGL